MKKLLSVVFFLLLAVTLAACEEKITDPNLLKIMDAQKDFKIENANALTSDISLPASFGGVAIFWESSDAGVVSRNGIVNRPVDGSGDKTVELTGRFVLRNATSTKKYTVKVLEKDPATVVATKTVDFVNLANEWVLTDQSFMLYYQQADDLPYVDVASFIQLLDGAILSDEITVSPVGEQGLKVSYEVEYEGETDSYSADFDFASNEVTFSSFDFFDGFTAETQTDFGNGLTSELLSYTDSEAVTIPLGYYGYDIIKHEGKYLIPFAVANQFFSGGMFDVYYNGEKLYGVDSYQLMDDATVVSQIQTSAENSLNASVALRRSTYNHLAFVMDYFYGLKPLKEVGTYYDMLQNHQAKMFAGTDNDMYRGTFEFANALDDLHTSYLMEGVNGPAGSNGNSNLTLNDLGPRVAAYYDSYFAIQSACAMKPLYKVVDGGKTAFIYIDGFDTETPAEFKSSLDTITALGTVENIVVDLSCNGGGNLGATIQVMGYMTEDPMNIYQKNATDNATAAFSYFSENNAVDVNWYILTSPVTFSAANLMTSMAKDGGFATIIGQNSSGGASSIEVILLPDGQALIISSVGVLSDKNFNSIEMGIEVDIKVSPTDESAIINAINAN
ncbi:MAG: S41 family peptidase [Acholeplasma sp.]|jgi:hypothetical protein|nr:S41 family peptidase [Acholeplasma sp.]